MVKANAEITIIDIQDTNKLQLVAGLTIESALLASKTLQLTLSNKAVVTVLDAERFIYETGGDPVVTGTAGGNYSTFNAFTLSVFGKSVPGDDSTIVQAGGAVIQADGRVTNKDVVITGTVSGVTGVKENFVWSQSNTGVATIDNFDIEEDWIQFDLAEAAGQATNMTKLSDLNLFNLNNGDKVEVSGNSITNEIIVSLGTGLDGASMSVKLLGMTDLSLVNIDII